MKNIILITFAAWFATACTSTSNDTAHTNKAKSPTTAVAVEPAAYCESVDGQVKTVPDSQDTFCVLPSGDVVKLQEFYDNNHQ